MANQESFAVVAFVRRTIVGRILVRLVFFLIGGGHGGAPINGGGEIPFSLMLRRVRCPFLLLRANFRLGVHIDRIR